MRRAMPAVGWGTHEPLAWLARIVSGSTRCSGCRRSLGRCPRSHRRAWRRRAAGTFDMASPPGVSPALEPPDRASSAASVIEDDHGHAGRITTGLRKGIGGFPHWAAGSASAPPETPKPLISQRELVLLRPLRVGDRLRDRTDVRGRGSLACDRAIPRSDSRARRTTRSRSSSECFLGRPMVPCLLRLRSTIPEDGDGAKPRGRSRRPTSGPRPPIRSSTRWRATARASINQDTRRRSMVEGADALLGAGGAGHWLPRVDVPRAAAKRSARPPALSITASVGVRKRLDAVHRA